MNKLKVYILVLAMLLLNGCGSSPNQNKEETSTVSGDIKKEVKLTKQEILSAFRFAVNKDAWKYGDVAEYKPGGKPDDYYKENSYIGQKREVEIYYGEGRNDFYPGHYLGYLYFPYQENGKTKYERFMAAFGEDGFLSFAPQLTSGETTKKINKKLTYLGSETFYFAKEEVTKPVYPESTDKKEKNIIEFRRAVFDDIYFSGSYSGHEYHVYIENFTDADNGSEVLLIDDDKNISYGVIYEQGITEGSEEKIMYFSTLPLEPRHWDNEYDRELAKKTMELSICDFTIVVP